MKFLKTEHGGKQPSGTREYAAQWHDVRDLSDRLDRFADHVPSPSERAQILTRHKFCANAIDFNRL